MRRLVEVASEDAEASLFLLGPGVGREIPGDLRASGLLFAFEDEINVGDRSVCEFVPSVGRRAVAVAARQIAGVIHVVGVRGVERHLLPVEIDHRAVEPQVAVHGVGREHRVPCQQAAGAAASLAGVGVADAGAFVQFVGYGAQDRACVILRGELAERCGVGFQFGELFDQRLLTVGDVGDAFPEVELQEREIAGCGRRINLDVAAGADRSERRGDDGAAFGDARYAAVLIDGRLGGVVAFPYDGTLYCGILGNEFRRDVQRLACCDRRERHRKLDLFEHDRRSGHRDFA